MISRILHIQSTLKNLNLITLLTKRLPNGVSLHNDILISHRSVLIDFIVQNDNFS